MIHINKKDILHHFILNLFTILNAEVIGCKIKKESKSKLLNLIKIASLVISNEKFFLDTKIEFFIQKTDIKDIVEIINAVNRPKHSTILSGQSIYINTDKHYLIEALKYLLQKLSETADSLEFQFNKKTNALIIRHNGNKPDISNQDSLLSTLNISTITTNEISFKYSMAILKALKIKIKSAERIIEIKFPK